MGRIAVDLTGKVALVTGSTRGLGRRMVSALADSGADVVVTSRNGAACQDVAEQVRKESGRRALARPCHVGRWEEISGLVDDVYAEFGHVDILVNNAGISPLYASLDAVSEDLFDKTIAVNLKGPFRLSALIGTRMAAGQRRLHHQHRQHCRDQAQAGLPALRRGQGRPDQPLRGTGQDVRAHGPLECGHGRAVRDRHNRGLGLGRLQRAGQGIRTGPHRRAR